MKSWASQYQKLFLKEFERSQTNMLRKISLLMLLVLVFGLMIVGPASANPGQPNFGPAIYGDGEVWGTKGAAALPAPNEHNLQSFDKLFVVTNSNNPAGQLPVAEAAPGNPNFNGGRWFTHTVEWTQAGFDAHGTVPVLKSYADVMVHYNLGHLEITAGSPGGPGAPPDYFECPMLPVK
jgi:hypothetical protein